MREILFRGKDKDNNWIYGYFNRFTNYKYDIYPAIIPILNDKSGSMSDLVRIKEETVGQYTGLKDKDGNKIFEGDIIKARHIEDLYIVKWEDCSFVIEDEWGGTIRRHQDSINRLECEVIGNIWDNPEMIKEKEDD